MSRITVKSKESRSSGVFHQVISHTTPTSPLLTLAAQRMKSTSSKSTEQTTQPPGSSQPQMQDPVAAAEEVVAVDVADVGVAGVVADQSRNGRTDPLTRKLLVMDMLATRGSAALNLMAIRTPERGGLRYPWLGQRQRRPKRTREISDFVRNPASILSGTD